MAFNIEEFIPRHNSSPETEALLDVAQQFLIEDLEADSTNFSSLKNPDKFPIDFKPLMETTYGYRTPQIREQTEEDIREQYKRLFDWVRLKGTTTGLLSYFFSIGFKVDTFPMVSDDYENFRAVNDENGLARLDEFFTPHFLLELTQLEVIEGEFINQEDFEIIQRRLEQILGAWAVPHFRFKTRGFAEEFPNVLQQNSVEAVTLDEFQINNSAKASECFEADGFDTLRTYQYMYTEFIDKVEVGTFDGTVDSTVTSLDSVLFTETDIDVVLRQANNLTKVITDLSVGDSLANEEWNALLFYDDGGDPILLFRYPDFEFLDGQYVEFRADNIVLKSPPEQIKARLNEQEGFGENEGVKTWLLDDYNFNYNVPMTTDITIVADKGFTTDKDFNVPYLTEMTRLPEYDKRGYWVAGNLDGTTSGSDPSLDSGDLWNPLMEPCSNYELELINSARRLEFRTPLHRVSDLFGESIEQLGLYHPDGTLLAVSEFPDLNITVDGFNDRVQFRMRMELPQNAQVF